MAPDHLNTGVEETFETSGVLHIHQTMGSFERSHNTRDNIEILCCRTLCVSPHGLKVKWCHAWAVQKWK